MNFEKEILEIKKRNKRVELDKAWETSLERKITIAIITYITVAFTLYFLGFENPFKNAIIPALAFVLSTSTLSFARKIWQSKHLK